MNTKRQQYALGYCETSVRIPKPQLLDTHCEANASCGCAAGPDGGNASWFTDGTDSPPVFGASVIPDWALQIAFVNAPAGTANPAYAACAIAVMSNGGQPYATQPGWMSAACWTWWQAVAMPWWAADGESIFAAWVGAGGDSISDFEPIDFLPDGIGASRIRVRLYGGILLGKRCGCQYPVGANIPTEGAECEDPHDCGCPVGEGGTPSWPVEVGTPVIFA